MYNKHVIIAEDHPLIAKGLEQILRKINPSLGITLTDTYSDLKNISKKNNPNYYIIDLVLLDGISIETIEYLFKLNPEINVIIYTGLSELAYAKRLIKLGVRGIISKLAKEDELIKACTKFLNNEHYLSELFLPHLFSSFTPTAKPVVNPFELLSDRELTIVEYLRNDTPIKIIAEKIGIKSNTAATYKKRAFQKLGVENVIQLVDLYQQSLHSSNKVELKNVEKAAFN